MMRRRALVAWWCVARCAARNEDGKLTIGCIGDSITQGTTATDKTSNRYEEYLQNPYFYAESVFEDYQAGTGTTRGGTALGKRTHE